MDQARPDSPAEMAPARQDGAASADAAPSLPPPPSYEHVLEETRLAVAQAEAEARGQDGAGAAQLQHEPEAAQDSGGGGGSSGVTTPVAKRPEIIHKSSKELYRAVAAEWGITCKMSDNCRCLDCQSCYFDCEYDQNEHEKTDGGLGAGTPMFISEVMHGTACNIL